MRYTLKNEWPLSPNTMSNPGSMDRMEADYDVEKVDLARHDVLYVSDVAPVATGKQLDERQNRNVGGGSFY